MRFEYGGMGGVNLAYVLYTLYFAQPRYIGVDESMRINKTTGEITHITVFGETASLKGKPLKRWIFEVIQPLHCSPTVSGRATYVWLVRRKGHYYVLKDSWPLESKPFSEIEHLLKINRAIMQDAALYTKLRHKFPIFVIGQDLGDSTALRRKDLQSYALDGCTGGWSQSQSAILSQLSEPSTSCVLFSAILLNVSQAILSSGHNSIIRFKQISNSLIRNYIFVMGTSA